MFSTLLDHINLHNILLLHTYLLTTTSPAKLCTYNPHASNIDSLIPPGHRSRTVPDVICQLTLISLPTAQLIDLKSCKQHMSPARWTT